MRMKRRLRLNHVLHHVVFFSVLYAGVSGVLMAQVRHDHDAPDRTRRVQRSNGEWMTPLSADEPQRLDTDPAHPPPSSSSPPSSSDASLETVIETLLKNGGSYTSIEAATAQKDWADLMHHRETTQSENRNHVPLALNLKIYALTKAGDSLPVYVFNATHDAPITVTVDSKGHFTPDLEVNQGQVRAQTKMLPNDVYTLSFRAVAGQTYFISSKSLAWEEGMYSIVARKRQN